MPLCMHVYNVQVYVFIIGLNWSIVKQKQSILIGSQSGPNFAIRTAHELISLIWVLEKISKIKETFLLLDQTYGKISVIKLV